jgi:hypothetical protein
VRFVCPLSLLRAQLSARLREVEEDHAQLSASSASALSAQASRRPRARPALPPSLLLLLRRRRRRLRLCEQPGGGARGADLRGGARPQKRLDEELALRRRLEVQPSRPTSPSPAPRPPTHAVPRAQAQLSERTTQLARVEEDAEVWRADKETVRPPARPAPCAQLRGRRVAGRRLNV